MSETSSESSEDGITTFTVCLLATSALIWLVLSFTQQRTHTCKGCCWGLPGTVSAVNFLNPHHRIIYALAFGAFTTQFNSLMFYGIQLEFTTVDNEYTDTFIKSILVVLLVMVVALLCFPVFACAEAPIRLVGYILGSLYCDLYAASILYQIVVLSQSSSLAITVIVLGSIVPQLVCLSIVLVWYHAKAITESSRVCYHGKAALFEKSEQYLHEEYVRNLLRGWKQPVEMDRVIFNVGKGFHYPFPFLIAIVIVTLTVFQLTVQTVASLAYVLSAQADSADANGYPDSAALYRKFVAVVVIMPIAAAALVYGLFFHLLYIMRKRIKAIWAGRSDHDINVHRIEYPSFTLASAVRYTGIQIASVIFAWLFYTMLFSLIGSFFVFFSYYPSLVGYYVYLLFVMILWTAGILVGQMLIVKLFFVTRESGSAQTIVINNRRAFNCFEYVVLLYNIAVGIMFNLLRLLLSFLITAVILLRMDRSLMLQGFELTDIGLRLYKNFITVESLLNNPVAHTFVNKLMTRAGHYFPEPTSFQGSGYESGYGSVFTAPTVRYSQRALNRWMVAYTLIKNRSLVSLRANNRNASNCNICMNKKDINTDRFYVGVSETSKLV